MLLCLLHSLLSCASPPGEAYAGHTAPILAGVLAIACLQYSSGVKFEAPRRMACSSAWHGVLGGIMWCHTHGTCCNQGCSCEKQLQSCGAFLWPFFDFGLWHLS
jgi:hypothetical protein